MSLLEGRLEGQGSAYRSNKGFSFRQVGALWDSTLTQIVFCFLCIMRWSKADFQAGSDIQSFSFRIYRINLWVECRIRLLFLLRWTRSHSVIFWICHKLFCILTDLWGLLAIFLYNFQYYSNCFRLHRWVWSQWVFLPWQQIWNNWVFFSKFHQLFADHAHAHDTQSFSLICTYCQ